MDFPSPDFERAYLETEHRYRDIFNRFYGNQIKNLVKIEEANPQMQRRGIDIIISFQESHSTWKFIYVEEKVDRIAHKTGNIGIELDNGFGKYSGWFYNTKADFLCYLIVDGENLPERILWIPMDALRRRWYNREFSAYPIRSHSEDNNTKRSSIKLIPVNELKNNIFEVKSTA